MSFSSCFFLLTGKILIKQYRKRKDYDFSAPLNLDIDLDLEAWWSLLDKIKWNKIKWTHQTRYEIEDVEIHLCKLRMTVRSRVLHMYGFCVTSWQVCIPYWEARSDGGYRIESLYYLHRNIIKMLVLRGVRIELSIYRNIEVLSVEISILRYIEVSSLRYVCRPIHWHPSTF